MGYGTKRAFEKQETHKERKLENTTNLLFNMCLLCEN